MHDVLYTPGIGIIVVEWGELPPDSSAMRPCPIPDFLDSPLACSLQLCPISRRD